MISEMESIGRTLLDTKEVLMMEEVMKKTNSDERADLEIVGHKEAEPLMADEESEVEIV